VLGQSCGQTEGTMSSGTGSPDGGVSDRRIIQCGRRRRPPLPGVSAGRRRIATRPRSGEIFFRAPVNNRQRTGAQWYRVDGYSPEERIHFARHRASWEHCGLPRHRHRKPSNPSLLDLIGVETEMQNLIGMERSRGRTEPKYVSLGYLSSIKWTLQCEQRRHNRHPCADVVTFERRPSSVRRAASSARGVRSVSMTRHSRMQLVSDSDSACS